MRQTGQQRIVSRRAVLAAGAVSAAGVLSACAGAAEGPSGPTVATRVATTSAPPGDASSSAPAATSSTSLDQAPTSGVRLIGDGSTSDTGPQPHQPAWSRLRPGETPPQFVVFSWDGGADLPQGVLGRFRDVAQQVGAAMTIFLSGIYCIPDTARTAYHPPRRPPGTSDIGFLDAADVRRTLTGIGAAWLDGHEIGTHFNGHFCGPRGGAGFTAADWRQELGEAIRLVTAWKSITGWYDVPPLPFDYRKELAGTRTPCLDGRAALLGVAREAGLRYDSSGNRDQVWPGRDQGLWDLSLQQLPFRGRTALGMDYTYLYQQSQADLDAGTPAQRARWRTEVVESLLAGLDRARDGNRAPLLIGNHFEQWNGGIYLDAVETAMREMARQPGVQLVSMRQLCDWLDLQHPDVVARLQELPVGQAPQQGWARLRT